MKYDALLPWQKLAYSIIANQLCDVLLLTGGYGSGKTAVNAHLIRKICETPNRLGIAIGRSKSSLQDTIVRTIDEEIYPELILNKAMGPNFSWELASREEGKSSTLISRTMQYGHEVGGQLKSINADFLWLIEASILPIEVYQVGLSRLRKSGPNAHYPVLIETNPDSTNNWIYKLFIDGAIETFRADDGTHWVTVKDICKSDNEGHEHHIKVVAIHTTSYANPHFPRNVIAQMEATYSESEKQRMIYGIWCAGEGRVWDEYQTFEHPTGRENEYFKQYDRFFLGCDPGQTHPTAVVFIGYKNGVYEVFDEYVSTNKSVRAVHAEIMKRYETWGIEKSRSIDIWVDPSARQWVEEWNEINTGIVATSATHRGTDPALNRAIRLGEMFRTGRLRVSTLCKCVIQDIEQTTYKTGSIKETVDKDAYDPHAMDAVGYAIMHEV